MSTELDTRSLDSRNTVDAAFARIVDELTRRGFLGGLAGGAALLGLAACGSNGPDQAATSTATRARTMNTVHGVLDLPNAPKRVVALDFPEACALLDLGITPVGRPGYLPEFAAYTRALAGVPVVTDADGKPIVEKVAALKPDLIVTADWADPSKQQMPYEQLRTIAPTAVFTWEQAAGNWPDQAADTATAVDRTAELDAVRRRYTDRAAGIEKANGALFGRTSWDVIDCSEQVWDLYSAASSHGQVLTAAGVRLGAARAQRTGYQEYSFEQFDRLADTDVIVTTAVSLPFLRKQPAFTRLPAALSGRVYPTELFFPASYGVALGLLDDLADICSKLAST